jgi:hypothetical protein
MLELHPFEWDDNAHSILNYPFSAHKEFQHFFFLSFLTKYFLVLVNTDAGQIDK